MSKKLRQLKRVTSRIGDCVIPKEDQWRFSSSGALQIAPPLRLDIGCGPNKHAPTKSAAGVDEPWTGIDVISFPGVDIVFDLVKKKPAIKYLGEENKEPPISYVGWPWKDNSVEEVHCSHCLEHFTAMERVHLMNEMWRVLKVGAKATIIVPHWASCRAYGDPTHQWPPVSEFYWFYLKKDWRMSQAPHTDASNLPGGLNCNFETTWGYSLEASVATRNQEYQQFAMQFYKESCQDTIATLVKLPEVPNANSSVPRKHPLH